MAIRRSILVRNRDYRHLFAAQVVMFGGDWFVVVPLIMLLLDLTGGSGLWSGMVLAVETGSTALLLPYAGTVADRLDRRRVMLVANVITAGAVVTLLLVRSQATAWISLAAVAVTAVAKAFYMPASSAALPNLVDRADLAEANVYSGSLWGTMLVVGSSLGGVAAAAVGPYTCFLIDVGCLVLSASLIWSVRRPMQGCLHAGGHRGRPLRDIAEAIRYIVRRPLIVSLVTVKSAVGFGNGVLAVFPLLVTVVFHAGPSEVGLVYAARGLGAMLGPVVLRRVLLNREHWLHPVLALSMVVYGLAYFMVGWVPSYSLALPLVTIAHIAGGGNWAMSNVALQSVVPDSLRGRVFAADVMIATLAVSLSQLGAGAALDYANPRFVVMGCALVTLVYGIGWRLVTRGPAFRREHPLVIVDSSRLS